MKKIIIALLIIINIPCEGQVKVLGRKTPTPSFPGTNLFVNDGNSLGRGYTNSTDITTNNIGKIVYDALSSYGTFDYYQEAVGGYHWSTLIANLPNHVFTHFSGVYTKMIVSVIEGTNTIQLGGTGAAAFAQTMTYIDSVLNEDARTCVLVYMTPNATPTYLSETQRVIYNDSLATITQTARLKVVDIRSEPLLNNSDAYLNATYYGDQIHLTEAGYAILGALGAAKAITF